MENSFSVCGQSKNCTPEDISCLKQGRIGHDAFDSVSKLWNEPLNVDLSNHDLNPIEDFEEALKNEFIIYDEYKYHATYH